MIRSRFILVTQHSREKPPEFFGVWISQAAQELLEGEPIRQSAKPRIHVLTPNRAPGKEESRASLVLSSGNQKTNHASFMESPVPIISRDLVVKPMTSSPGHSPEVACALALSRRGAEAHGVVLPGSNAIGKDRIGANPGKNEPVLT